VLSLRFRHLCQRKLSLSQSFRINVLCEFTSAVTPSAVGGSGVAELMFRLYYSDFLPDASIAILAAMLWRLIFYYPFLIMGALVLPKWIGKGKERED